MNEWLWRSQLHFHFILLFCKALEGAGSVVGKFILSSGIHVLLYKFYGSATAAFALSLFSWFIETEKLPFTRDVLVRLLLSSFFSCAGNISVFYGLKAASPDLATVLSCSIPIMASVIAVVLRVETLHILRYDGQCKIMGIVLTCIGAAVMSLYEGPELLNLTKDEDRRFGALLILFGCFSIAVSVNIHAPLLKQYRTPWTIMFIITFTSAVVTAAISLIVVEKWTLPSPGILALIICYAVLGTALIFGGTAWVLARTGIFLIVCYTSVAPVSTTILSIIFLGTSLYMGSIIGTVLVICGVLFFGWSEAESKKLASPANNNQQPLL